MLNSALELASLGYHVHPVMPTKRPILQGWPEVATTEPGTIESWWGGRYQNNPIGIVTGHVSGCFVIDIDGDEGMKSLEWMIQRLGDIPPTVTARTPRGLHIYGRLPSDIDIRNTTRMGDMPGVDVRGIGGYVVAAPSVCSHGSYRWIVPPTEMEPALLPDSWMSAVMEPRMAMAC